ncbi:MAG: DedA family protein [Candidatus Woesearchaeota archaeon]|nr:DedA family protein [Nanoarchaeota archaeon]USN44464.1 MAG: DedA family protein [Candidatus Woesearchaeota archaeon]
MNIEQVILTLSYFGILLLMTSNGLTSLPSSQILYIVCGIFAAKGDLSLTWIILIGALGHTGGNWLLYEIARKKGMTFILKFKLFPEKQVKKVSLVFNKKPIFYLFIGKLVNPVKVFIPIPAGIAKMHRGIFLLITYITSAIWAALFVGIGYLFKEGFNKFGYLGGILLALGIIIILYFYKQMNTLELPEEKKEIRKKIKINE